MSNRTVNAYASPISQCLSPESKLTEAKERMLFEGVRHLPVIDAGRLVGMVSLSDLFAIESLVDVDPDETQIRSIMSTDVYTVEPQERLGAVVHQMSEKKISSAVVLKNEAPVGVFTTTDACRALAELLEQT